MAADDPELEVAAWRLLSALSTSGNHEEIINAIKNLHTILEGRWQVRHPGKRDV